MGIYRIGLCSLMLFFVAIEAAEVSKTGFGVCPDKSIEQIRQEVEPRANALAKFTWNEYAAIIDELGKERYIVSTGKDFNATINKDKVVVYMRHDIDVNPFAALKMAKMEKQRGLSSTYYILHSAKYYGQQSESGVLRYAAMDSLYQKLAEYGHEIGVHNDLIGLMIQSDIDPVLFQREELDYYCTAGFDIVGVVSHGSSVVLKRGLNNTWIFSEFGKEGTFENNGNTYRYGDKSVEDFGFQYEGYRLGFNQRCSDVGGKFASSIKDATDFVDFLQKCKPGDRVSFLTHPVWWGKEDR